ncbi:MAG: prolipoprotein diacylglyceryl transferase [Oscillospiraceae bacterium]|nr:prolipoprotein diacylglyceryl transferase [Oscillospiraceae bacterium]
MSTVSFPGLGITVQVKSIAFRLFSWPLHWYGIIIAGGFLAAVIFCSRRAHRFGIEQDDIVDLLLYAVPLCIIGARLYYIIFYLDRFRKADGSLDPASMLRIWDGGLAIYGAIIAAIIIAVVFCHKRGINFFSLADLGVYGLLIGQMVGRWGNFVNVECYGGPTDLPWRMGIFESVNGVYQYTEVHPTFLYESLWNLVGLLLLAFVLERYRKFDGQIFFSYLAWYGLGRAWIEGMRTDSLYFFSTGLRVSQVLAIASCVVAVVVLLVQLFRPHSPEELWGNQVAAREAAKEKEKEIEEVEEP